MRRAGVALRKAAKGIFDGLDVRASGNTGVEEEGIRKTIGGTNRNRAQKIRASEKEDWAAGVSDAERHHYRASAAKSSLRPN